MKAGCRFPLLLIVALCVLPAGGAAAAIVSDSFDLGVKSPPWYMYPGSGHIMETSPGNGHTAPPSALAQPNWRYPYTIYQMLPAAYDGGVYLSGWVQDECNTNPGLPGPPDNPNWHQEHVPHALIKVEDSNGFEWLHFGTIGKNKLATDPQWADNIYFSINTFRDGKKILTGPPTSPLPVRREPGWRKWMIRIKPYTLPNSAPGDVEYYLDGQLVYQGQRALPGPFGPPSVDRIVCGSQVWTGEWYWYDDVEFDYWPAPAAAANIQEALSYADGTWVQVNGLSVESVYPDSITVSDSQADMIDIYPARYEAPGDVVNVLGRLATGTAGRYVDAQVVERVSTVPLVALSDIADARALPDGTRVRISNKVVTASLFAHRFIQEDDRTAGLKIRNIYEPVIGNKITVEGQMMTVGAEKLLEAEKVTINSVGNALPKPFGVPNRTLYPPSVIPSGMLVVTTGRVVNKPSAWYPLWVEIKDGSQKASDPPVRVMLPSYTVGQGLIVGDYIRVKGAAGWLDEGAGSRPKIYCRYLDDVKTLQVQ